MTPCDFESLFYFLLHHYLIPLFHILLCFIFVCLLLEVLLLNCFSGILYISFTFFTYFQRIIISYWGCHNFLFFHVSLIFLSIEGFFFLIFMFPLFTLRCLHIQFDYLFQVCAQSFIREGFCHVGVTSTHNQDHGVGSLLGCT